MSNTLTKPLTPNIIPRDQHPISRQNISEAALKVLTVLRKHGFQAFIVGGSVRDLLLGGHPKDFDVSTDATPEQVKSLFRGALIIGRRFKIVHVRHRRDIVEVTTFRGHHGDDIQSMPQQHTGRKALADMTAARSEHGLLLRDNVYGTLEEDAMRRDFTINALYYTTKDFAIYDYAGGLADLQAKTIRIIGDPTTRYQEDPVRLLRAIRFCAKLDFQLAPETAAPIVELAPLLHNIPPARLFDEVVKILMSGYGVAAYRLLQQYGLFETLFPATTAAMAHDALPWHSEPLLLAALRNTDHRIQENKPVTPAFLFAALLWPAIQPTWQALQAQGIPIIPAMQQASRTITFAQRRITAIPRRFGMPLADIWALQLQLSKHGSHHRTERLLAHRRFRAGYDFLLLREETGEPTNDLGQWWTEYQQLTPEQRIMAVKK